MKPTHDAAGPIPFRRKEGVRKKEAEGHPLLGDKTPAGRRRVENTESPKVKVCCGLFLERVIPRSHKSWEKKMKQKEEKRQRKHCGKLR